MALLGGLPRCWGIIDSKTSGARGGRALRPFTNVARSLPIFLEFSDLHVTKGSGLQFAADRLGFTRETAVGFGDGENDIELLEWAGFGVAVDNATPVLKAIADWVCPSVDDDGVAQVIEAVLARGR